jgi:hypothetical protein
MKHLKPLMVSLAVATVAALSAPAAFAEKPIRQPPVPVADFTIPDSCSFAVGVHADTNKEVTKTFSDGRTLVTGAFKFTLTNLANTSKSISINIPGPGTFTTTDDGGLLLTAEGPWLFFFAPDELGLGTPGMLLLTTGRATLQFNPDGTEVFSHTTGTTTDLCAVLADP